MNSSAYIHDVARFEARQIHVTQAGGFARDIVITGKDGATVELTMFAATASALVIRDEGDHAAITHDLDRAAPEPAVCLRTGEKIPW